MTRFCGTILILAALVAPCASGAAPDISSLPGHPRLWIGGVKDAPGYIDPASLAERAKTHATEFTLLKNSTYIDGRALYAAITADKDAIAGVAGDLRTFEVADGHSLYPYVLAFDWVAASLSDADRKEIAKHIGDVAVVVQQRMQRYSAFDNNTLRRSMGVALAALAIAGDDPRSEELFRKEHQQFEDFVDITGDRAEADDMLGRGAFGGGWPEGYDYDRHGSRYAMIYFLGLRSATGMDVFTASRYWKEKQLFHIYQVLPNGRNQLPFQDNDNPYLHRFDREAMLVLAHEYDDPHSRWYLNHVNTVQERASACFEFLYNEPGAPEHDFSDLPKAHYIPGTGMVYARSGWGPNDTYVAFCASDWYVYHQNNAQNTFAVYRNAPLAIKDGVYDGGGSTHFWDYTIRTISYNGITVLDPNEAFHGPDEAPDIANDGGQMVQQWTGDAPTFEAWRKQARRAGSPMRDIVDWLAFDANDTYAYCAAEAGRAYSPGKVPFFSRQLVFIYPSWIIVFDRVKSGDAAFAKQFHLHAPEEMTVAGNEAIITTKTTNGATTPGRLFVQSLLPSKARVERVEGLATYGGKSYVHPEPYNDQILCPVHLLITAPEEQTTFFLTAMYACDADVEKAPEAKIVEDTADKVTLSLEGKWTMTFNKTGDAGWKMLE